MRSAQSIKKMVTREMPSRQGEANGVTSTMRKKNPTESKRDASIQWNATKNEQESVVDSLATAIFTFVPVAFPNK